MLAIAVVMAVGACSGGDGSTTTTPGAVDTTSTVAPVTSTSGPTTTTTPATSTTTPDTNTLASGSGCTPGSDELPDGEWFGYVLGAAPGVVDFDLACWFSGDAADLAAAEDGEESPAPNGYYIRNVNPQVRTVDVSPTVEVLAMANIGDPATEGPMAFDDWVALRVDDAEVPMDVWVVVEDDLVVSITEQYRP
jgi:hypothetical protein